MHYIRIQVVLYMSPLRKLFACTKLESHGTLMGGGELCIVRDPENCPRQHSPIPSCLLTRSSIHCLMWHHPVVGCLADKMRKGGKGTPQWDNILTDSKQRACCFWQYPSPVTSHTLYRAQACDHGNEEQETVGNFSG